MCYLFIHDHAGEHVDIQINIRDHLCPICVSKTLSPAANTRWETSGLNEGGKSVQIKRTLRRTTRGGGPWILPLTQSQTWETVLPLPYSREHRLGGWATGGQTPTSPTGPSHMRVTIGCILFKSFFWPDPNPRAAGRGDSELPSGYPRDLWHIPETSGDEWEGDKSACSVGEAQGSGQLHFSKVTPGR
jgi:hypothetical protein